MSTATLVPETWDASGAGAWDTVRRTGLRPLLAGAAVRLRAADGFSHARSMAYVTSLLTMQGLIALVGLASAVGSSISPSVRRLVQATAPGPVGDALSTAIDQARSAGQAGRITALAFGLIGSLVTAASGMGQLQRSLNRLYGLEADRPTLSKYRLATVLALTAGTFITLAFVLLATGSALGDTVGDNPLTPAWGIAQILLAAMLLVVGVALLFRWCPHRRQPGWSWLALGAGVSVTGWVLVTALLGLVFRYSSTFGRAYGSLAGIVALLLWALLSSIAMLFGASVAAALEGVRASRRAD